VSTSGINEQVNLEIQYRSILERILSEYRTADFLLQDLQACYRSKALSATLSPENKELAVFRAAQASTTRETRTLNNIAAVQAEIADINTLISELQQIQTEVNSAADLFETQEALANYEEFIADNRGRFHGPEHLDLTRLDDLYSNRRLQAVITEMATLKDETRVLISACQIFPNTPTGGSQSANEGD